MATITAVGTYLDNGTARTAGEAMTITTGGQLIIRTDTRVHANAPAANTGYLGAVTVTEGECFIDAQNVRWLAYSGVTAGNVPAIGTAITQGGVSGYLLGVWANYTSAPTAVGVACPASGYIKLREVTGGSYAAGAITGLATGASASGADVPGWIEVVFGGVDITVPRLGKFKTRGQWFYLADTNGTRTQVIQVPTNGGGANTYCPGVWVETAPSSGVYEQWPALNGTNGNNGWSVIHMGAAEGQTDARHKFVKMLSTGQMQFGETVTFASTYGSVAAQASTYVDWNVSGTYTLTSNVCTVYVSAGHGLYGGETVGLDFPSGPADTTGTATVLDAYYFTVPVTNADTSGSVTVRLGATITFTAHGLQEGNQVGLTVSTGTLPTTTTYTVHSVGSANAYNILHTHTAALTSGNCSALHTLQVTRTAHGMAIGNQVYLDFTSGGATDGVFTIRAVAANTFNVNYPHYAAITAGATVTERYEIGKVPASGCKVRIPNIFVRNGTSASNNVPNATLSSRPEFITTSAGAIDIEYMYGENIYTRFGQAYSLRMMYSATMEILEVTECATAIEVEDVFAGNYSGIALIPLVVTSCFAGGSIKKAKFFRVGTPGANGHTANISFSSGLTLDAVESGSLQYVRSTGYFILDNCSDFTALNTRSYNAELRLSSCTNTTVTNHDHVGRFTGYTNATTGLYGISNRYSNGITVTGLTFGFGGTVANVHAYLGGILGEYSKNCKYRSIGSNASPLNGGTWEPSLYNMLTIYTSGAGNTNTVKAQRIFGTGLRGAYAVGQTNSDKNVNYETVIAKEPYAHGVATVANRLVTVYPSTLNADYKGVSGIRTVTGQASVYGTHFMSLFMGKTYGQIALAMNEPTTETSPYFTMVSGTAKFNSAGGILMGVIGNKAIWETKDWIIGHTGFVNEVAQMSGGTIGNYRFYYQIDTGSGYSALSAQLTAAQLGTALAGETISPSTGFKLKLTIETTSTNTTAITFLTIRTTTTESAQSTNLYPLDQTTLTLTGLVSGSDVTILAAGTETVLNTTEDWAGTSYGYTYETAQPVDVVLYKPGYIPFFIRNYSLGTSNASLPCAQVADVSYLI